MCVSVGLFRAGNAHSPPTASEIVGSMSVKALFSELPLPRQLDPS